MTTTAIRNTAQAERLVTSHTTPRMRRLALLRAYVAGTQYSGRPSWYDKERPVWEREPVVQWPAVAAAITSNEDLLLGEGRYPTITARPEEDEDDDSGLDEDASESVNAFLRGLEREASLRAHFRAQYSNGLAVGSIVGVFGARNGRVFADCVSAEYCTPEYDADGAVTRIVIEYPYVNVAFTAYDGWRADAFVFRRVIDAKRDVTYLPARIIDEQRVAAFVEDPQRAFAHGLDFCPVIFNRFRLVTTIVNETDGHAIHSERTCREIDAFNLEASVRHDGAIASLPQKFEIGVEPGYNPTATTPVGAIAGTPRGGRVDPVANPHTGQYFASGADMRATLHGARKQGPGYTWQYASPETKVGQLTVDAGALEALAGTMSDLRARICEALAWVPMNPEDVKFAASMSGKALERTMARQLNRVAKDRDGFGFGYMIPALKMLLRIAVKLGAAIRTRGAATALPALAKLVNEPPPLTLKWGAWFAPTPEDDEKLINATKTAYDAKFITLRTAVEKIARTFGIENVAAYLETLEAESAERADREIAGMAKAIGAAHGGLDDDDRPRSGGDATAPNRGRGRGVAAAPTTAGLDRPDDGSRATGRPRGIVA